MKTDFQFSASFAEATFQSNAYFFETRFPGITDFAEATFQRNACFLEARFMNADFRNVIFQGNADFRGAAFLGATKFNMTVFERNLEFDPEEIEELDLEYAQFLFKGHISPPPGHYAGEIKKLSSKHVKKIL